MLSFWCKPDADGLRRTVKTIMPSLAPKVDWRQVDFSPGHVLLPQPGEVIVGMGTDVLEALQKAGYLPKGRKVNSSRGKVYTHLVKDPDGNPVGVGHWMISFAPGLIHQEADKESLIKWDARLAHRYLTTSSLVPLLGTYGYTHTLKYVQEYIQQSHEATQKPIQVSLDLETMGFYPWYPDKKIVTVQVTVAPGYADVIYLLDPYFEDPANLDLFLSELRALLNDPRVAIVGANLKFDLNWIRAKWGIVCTNFRLDTTIVGSLLDENRSNSLNWHAKEMTPMGGYDDEFNDAFDKGKMELIDPDDLLPYAGGDTDACYQVAEFEKAELKKQPTVSRLYTKLVHPAARAFEAIEFRGLCADLDEFQQLEIDLTEKMADYHKASLALIPGRIKARYADDLSLTRKAIIKEYLFGERGLGLTPLMTTAKSGEPAVDKAHLMMFLDHEVAGPFIRVYQEWSKCQKFLGTYVHGFLNHLRPDGRFHPTYMLFAGAMFENEDDSGTVTGRLAAKNPAVQTIPKHDKVWAPRLRRCFNAPPGMVFWSADYSQGELRITACVANEKNMLDVYASGKDLHCMTGAQFAGMEYDEFIALEKYPKGSPELTMFKDYRQQAKAANFGLIYGMQAMGFKEYARVAYGVHFTEEEAFEIREKFFATYPGLLDWHEEYKAWAKQDGEVVSPLGRVRHLPLIHSRNWSVKSEAERQAINSPIQGTLSDMNCWAAAILEEEMGGEDQLWIAGATHDNLYGYCPEDTKDQYLYRVREVMQTLPLKPVFGWDHQLDFPVDLEIGPNMGDLEKYALAA